MDMSSRPIGVFDSGLGGLTAVKEIMEILPHEDIIYLGDTARVPYGTKSRETIIKYAREDLGFLKRRGVKFAIAACGTVSSVMAGDNAFKDELCAGVIRPAAEAACAATKNKKIGVIATGASIKSGNYERLIGEILPGAEVYSKACPMFVPLVENGCTSPDCEPTRWFAREYLEPLREAGIDTLLLGCTHYPLLSEIISLTVGEKVRLISSGAEAAKYAKKKLGRDGILNPKRERGGVSLFCTDSAELFRENASHFISLDGISVEHMPIDG